MQFTTFLAVFTAFSASLLPTVTNALAIPVVNVARDVYVPEITSPVAGTAWVLGEQAVVTWKNADAPTLISNGQAVMLRKGGAPLEDKNGGSYFLTTDFNPRTGFVEFTVPSDLAAGDDYAITLFGDSGNISEEFSILTQEPGTD
ncbi:hypothetical protein D9758_006585 [Tetrapyrgos nigripes]|uniref:Ser-Thr-rich glycosyl-phosphatidyl-inositol-anchored membrane family-domain-containing protein n=1 Tax=Tetrapyrgos nigripes TaxID=182062 RepID=A0A8H5LQN1_9AGAR|nr:hypothetical protein D9758_017408 [Tetrapyrgos nigripes]KAF5365933.1 hypothetical protein D9758_006585 [Tetrapyrgos nigripes]